MVSKNPLLGINFGLEVRFERKCWKNIWALKWHTNIRCKVNLWQLSKRDINFTQKFSTKIRRPFRRLPFLQEIWEPLSPKSFQALEKHKLINNTQLNIGRWWAEWRWWSSRSKSNRKRWWLWGELWERDKKKSCSSYSGIEGIHKVSKCHFVHHLIWRIEGLQFKLNSNLNLEL